MQIDPRFPPRLSLSDTFWLRVANIFRFPKIFISLIRPSIWMMLILIVFSPITAPCAECLVGTIITRTIESHLPCFDKRTSSDTRQMAPASLHLSLVMVDIPGPGTHGHTQSGERPVIRWCGNIYTFLHIEYGLLCLWHRMLVSFVRHLGAPPRKFISLNIADTEDAGLWGQHGNTDIFSKLSRNSVTATLTILTKYLGFSFTSQPK